MTASAAATSSVTLPAGTTWLDTGTASMALGLRAKGHSLRRGAWSGFTGLSLTTLIYSATMSRDEVFESLTDAHTRAWNAELCWNNGRGNWINRMQPHVYARFLKWRMAWWAELERGFPDKIKGGILCR